jgi:hypothetical protein
VESLRVLPAPPVEAALLPVAAPPAAPNKATKGFKNSPFCHFLPYPLLLSLLDVAA